MKNKVFIAMTAICLMLISCDNEPETDLTKTAFIPKPASVEASGGEFELENDVIIYVEEGNDTLMQTAQYLSNQLNNMLGFAPVVQQAGQLPKEGIFLSHKPGSFRNEEYMLVIGKELVMLEASTPEGAFYGVQTLLQTIAEGETEEDEAEIATGIIQDFPEYAYRGAMLDVSRHFFPPEDVKRFIDLLAAYKMNALHLHLSDDQGWRIEIKSWPKLTEIGGSTQVGGGEGGFYTQEEYADIVKYAQDRHITIVPEIDMPGHTNAALASYPELNCDDKARELYTGTDVGFSTLCTRKEITYQFVDDVVREISELTPGPYFHIGGDESHVTEHDDYVYFVNRVQDIVTSHGKKVIGWDEIANAELVDSAIVQFWANQENTTMGIGKGAGVIMSPAAKAYLDMKYDSTTTLGLNWAGYIEVDSAYMWNPGTLVEGIKRENILGIEAPLWSETVTNMEDIEYMVFPRLPGYAEIGWTAPELRDWEDYRVRLAKHAGRFEKMEINFYKSPLVPWEEYN